MKSLHKITFARAGAALGIGAGGLVLLALATSLLVYPAEYIYRVVVWQESDAFDWQKFPSHPLTASPTPQLLPVSPDPRVAALFGQLAGAADWGAYLASNQTQAFIVIQDGTVLYEQYFNGTQRDSIVTSFSMAKSFTSELVGRAIDEGYIRSVDDPITLYLPELAERDERFSAITIRHLLRMASGLDYQEFRPMLFNGDDPLTTYFPDQRQLALENTHSVEAPGQHFRYNKYHPQLLGMILERTTGMSVTTYLQSRLWDPLGMEYGGSWSTDSRDSDFEKMETGVNARAIDFAKFGVLFVDKGEGQGQQLISRTWVVDSTQPYLPPDDQGYYPEYFASLPGHAYYQLMWWGFARDRMMFDFAAEGDKGQFIYVVPHKRLVIVRHGTDYGVPSEAWLRLFYAFGSEF